MKKTPGKGKAIFGKGIATFASAFPSKLPNQKLPDVIILDILALLS